MDGEEYRFRCDKCKHVTNKKSHFDAHMRIHLRKNPTSKQLPRKRRNKPKHSCDICGYKSDTNLARHKREVHGVVPVKKGVRIANANNNANNVNAANAHNIGIANNVGMHDHNNVTNNNGATNINAPTNNINGPINIVIAVPTYSRILPYDHVFDLSSLTNHELNKIFASGQNALLSLFEILHCNVNRPEHNNILYADPDNMIVYNGQIWTREQSDKALCKAMMAGEEMFVKYNETNVEWISQSVYDCVDKAVGNIQFRNLNSMIKVRETLANRNSLIKSMKKIAKDYANQRGINPDSYVRPKPPSNISREELDERRKKNAIAREYLSNPKKIKEANDALSRSSESEAEDNQKSKSESESEAELYKSFDSDAGYTNMTELTMSDCEGSPESSIDELLVRKPRTKSKSDSSSSEPSVEASPVRNPTSKKSKVVASSSESSIEASPVRKPTSKKSKVVASSSESSIEASPARKSKTNKNKVAASSSDDSESSVEVSPVKPRAKPVHKPPTKVGSKRR